ncbi:MAG: hypothetical protein QM630_05980, partial [Microbacterium sp.]
MSTGILLLIALVSILIGGFTSKNSEATTVAVTSETAAAVEALPNVEITEVHNRAEAKQLLRSEEVEAAVLPGEGPLGYTVVALEDAPSEIVSGLSVAPTVEILEPASTNPLLRYFIALGFGLVFFIAASTFGATIAQSVVEEKQTRVVEVLLAALYAAAASMVSRMEDIGTFAETCSSRRNPPLQLQVSVRTA